MVSITRAEFEDAVNDALDTIPDALFDAMDNVVIVVDDEPDADDPDLLGVYEGVPLTERWDAGPLWPDRIVIFQGPLQRMCTDREDLVEQISITVVHEVAHHFGIDDRRLHDLGWG
ncbi:MAG TPA: metallopeptidase family protein [Propionibacteriaceae bacterium]|nr:metallopeptidase family protein [Propionibacteriaceae bacterium]